MANYQVLREIYLGIDPHDRNNDDNNNNERINIDEVLELLWAEHCAHRIERRADADRAQRQRRADTDREDLRRTDANLQELLVLLVLLHVAAILCYIVSKGC